MFTVQCDFVTPWPPTVRLDSLTFPKEVQIGPKEVQTGPKEVQTGPKDLLWWLTGQSNGR